MAAGDGDGVSVETPSGAYVADRCILSAGAWTTAFTVKLGLSLRVSRQTVYWFRPAKPELLTPERFPIYVWHLPGDTMIYGFADFGEGAKVGIHNPIHTTDPDAVDREVSAAEVERMHTLMRDYLPDAAGEFLRAEVCLYTNTPDGHFLLDFHPRHPQVVVASPCSGHGFKFSAAIGEVLADLVTSGSSRFDLGLFSLDRLLPEKAK